MKYPAFIKAKNLIQHFEGFVPHMYTCAGGFQTIGYGHRLRPQESLLRSVTQVEADHLLDQDLHLTAQAVARLIKVPLISNQWVALMSFTFNVGAGALQRSTLRSKVNRNDHLEVPREFLKWIFAGGRECPGLMRRRQIEAGVYTNKVEINF